MVEVQRYETSNYMSPDCTQCQAMDLLHNIHLRAYLAALPTNPPECSLRV